MTEQEWATKKKVAADEAGRRFLELVEISPGWFELRNSGGGRVFPEAGEPCGCSLSRIRGYFQLNPCP
jgi:hypothetical protein